MEIGNIISSLIWAAVQTYHQYGQFCVTTLVTEITAEEKAFYTAASVAQW